MPASANQATSQDADSPDQVQFGRLELKKKAVIAPSQTERKIQQNLVEAEQTRQDQAKRESSPAAPQNLAAQAPGVEDQNPAQPESQPAGVEDTSPAQPESQPAGVEDTSPTQPESQPAGVEDQALTQGDQDDPFAGLSPQAFAGEAPEAPKPAVQGVQEGAAAPAATQQQPPQGEQAPAIDSDDDDGGFSEQALITGNPLAADFFDVAPQADASAFEPEVTEQLNRTLRSARSSGRAAAVISVAIGAVIGLLLGIGLAIFAKNPAQPDALTKADLLSKTGRAGEAIGLYQKLLQEQPGLAVARHNLGVALALNGDQQAADQALQQYLKVAKDSAEIKKVRLYLAKGPKR